jgi:hypothetical protein
VGFDRKPGDRIDPVYRSDVLARNRSPVYASLDWLKERNATLGSEGLPPDFEQCFSDMVIFLRKIEVWWIANVEIPTNPDYDGSDIVEEAIVPGPIMSMQLLLDIALGDEERSRGESG